MKQNSLQLYKEWIKKAKNDIKTAKILFNEKGPTDTLCFHCQQAVEKYLKGYLSYHRIRFKKTHDLSILMKLAERINKDFLNFEKEFKILNAYYIESRYPSEITSYTRKECKEALEIVKNTVNFIQTNL